MENRNSILTSEAITERAEIIGVPLARLAGEAGVAASTPYRWSKGASSTRTLRKVQAALEARERRLLTHLIELHPDIVATRAAA